MSIYNFSAQWVNGNLLLRRNYKDSLMVLVNNVRHFGCALRLVDRALLQQRPGTHGLPLTWLNG